jgi:predicted LPLAT superfamily acyltransferase
MTAAWLTQRERSNLLALRTIIWIGLALGRRAARALLYPIAGYYVCFSRAPKRASQAYLTRVLGRPPRWGEVFRHYHTFASTILDRVFLLCGRFEEFDVSIHGDDVAYGFHQRHEGCVLLGAHFGSFEILRAVGLRHPGVEVRFAMFEANAQKISRVFAALNPDLAQAIIALGTPDAMLNVNEALAHGAYVGMLADRSFVSGKRVECDFFGTPALFPAGPWQLACALHRPVLLGLGVYLGGRRYEVHFEQIVDVWPTERAARNAAIEDAVRRYAARLEEHCRRAPYNWFNFFDFWAERNDASSPR